MTYYAIRYYSRSFWHHRYGEYAYYDPMSLAVVNSCYLEEVRDLRNDLFNDSSIFVERNEFLCSYCTLFLFL